MKRKLYRFRKIILDTIYVIKLNLFAEKRNQQVMFEAIWFSNREQFEWWVKEVNKLGNRRAKLDWDLYHVKD